MIQSNLHQEDTVHYGLQQPFSPHEVLSVPHWGVHEKALEQMLEPALIGMIGVKGARLKSQSLNNSDQQVFVLADCTGKEGSSREGQGWWI